MSTKYYPPPTGHQQTQEPKTHSQAQYPPPPYRDQQTQEQSTLSHGQRPPPPYRDQQTNEQSTMSQERQRPPPYRDQKTNKQSTHSQRQYPPPPYRDQKTQEQSTHSQDQYPPTSYGDQQTKEQSAHPQEQYPPQLEQLPAIQMVGPQKQGKQRSPAIWGLLSILGIPTLIWYFFVWKEIKEYKNDPKINPVFQLLILIAVLIVPLAILPIIVGIILAIFTTSPLITYILLIPLGLLSGLSFFLYKNMFKHVKEMQISCGTHEEKTLDPTIYSALISLAFIVPFIINSIIGLLIHITGLGFLSIINLIFFLFLLVPAAGVFLGQARLNQIWVNLGQKPMKDKLGKKIIKIVGDVAGDYVEDITGSKKLGKKMDKSLTKGLKKEQKSHKHDHSSPETQWPPGPYPPQQGQYPNQQEPAVSYPPQQGQYPNQQEPAGSYPPQQGQYPNQQEPAGYYPPQQGQHPPPPY